MGALRCVDGSVLSVLAVACSDRTGTPYEITLDLRRDHQPFASVGERCGFRLSQLAASVTAAREDPEQAAAWPDPDDRFPEPLPGEGAGGRMGGQASGRASGRAGGGGFRPREREYFSLRSRDRSDLPGRGELRCVLRDSAEWLGPYGPRAPGQPRGWRLSRRAVIEAWGADGIGLRAVLTSAELVTFLDTVLKEPDGGEVAACAPAGAGGPSPLGRAERVPDGSARSRLPALRA
jgi:hypothetical protein